MTATDSGANFSATYFTARIDTPINAELILSGHQVYNGDTLEISIDFPLSSQLGLPQYFNNFMGPLSFYDARSGRIYSTAVSPDYWGTTGSLTITAIDTIHKTATGTWTPTVVWNYYDLNDSLIIGAGQFYMPYVIK